MQQEQHPALSAAAAGPSAYRAYARQWLRENLPQHMRADSLEYRTPTLDECRDWEASMYEAGLAGMTWPKVYGGLGLTLREHLVVNKEVGALAMPESVSSIGKELAGPIIQTVGTEEQKQQFLPRILAMKDYWCQGFSEPDAGSDLARLRTKAVKEGETWRINGQKGSLAEQFAGHARHATLSDWLLVSGNDGGAVLLDLASVTATPDGALDPEFPQTWLSLEGAKVLAEVDADTFSALKRDVQILIASLVNGAAESALSATASYMSTRVQFGRPLSAK